MGPLAQIAYKNSNSEFRNRLENAMHVHLENGMGKRVWDIVEAFPEGCFEGKMPHDKVFIEGLTGTGILLLKDDRLPHEKGSHEKDDPDTIYVFESYDELKDGSIGKYLFGFIPKTNTVTMGKNDTAGMSTEEIRKSKIFRENCAGAAAIDLLLTLMCEPRFVVQSPYSKLKRQMAGRKIGQKAMSHTWVKLGWTIGSAVKAKCDIAGSAPAKAYHLVRAHWRDYGDRRTPKSVRREGRDGWWVWIESQHRGNPALGEIKHHYVPKLDDQKSARVVRDVLAAKFYQASVKL